MKARLTLIILLLLAGAIVSYFTFFEKKLSENINDLIPQGSVAIIHSKNPKGSFELLSKYSWWNALKALPFLGESGNVLDSIGSFVENKKIQSRLNQLEHSISLHITGKDQLETLHFVKSDGFDWSSESIELICGLLWPEEVIDKSQRQYEDLVIHELKLGDNVGAYIIIGEFLIFSANAILIEDVIRTSRGLATGLYQSFSFKPSSRNNLSLIINTAKLKSLSEVFFNETIFHNQPLEGLVELDLNLEEQDLSVNGRLFADKNNLRKGLGKTSLKERDFMPNALSNVQILPISFGDTQIPDFDISGFSEAHNSSLTLVEIDAGQETKEWVGIASLTDQNKAESLLNGLSLELVKGETDTLYQEEFMDGAISFLNEGEIINEIYGFSQPSFGPVYYSVYNEVLVFAETVNAVKLILQEYDNENTWGKTVEKRKFLDDLVQETISTRLVNFQYSVDGLRENLRPKWREFFDAQQGLLNIIDLVAFQLSASGESYFVNAQASLNPIVQRPVSSSTAEVDALELQANAFADQRITSRPFVVRNHNDGAREVLIQDETNQIYLLSRDGTLIWKRELEGRINGSVNQVDFYNNRKLQFLFVTDSFIHLVDRNGNNVEGFPKSIETELPLQDLDFVDYDNSKRYRYVGTDRRGNVYLFDKQGNALEGWNPRPSSQPLLEIPRHIRVRGRDCFVMVRTNGTIELTNRRGDYYDGFPFNIGKRLSGEVRITQGPDFARSVIHVVSEDGLQVGINLNGQKTNENQLFKPLATSEFSLISDKLGTNHIVVRRDLRESQFFDAKGKELLKSDLTLDDDDKVYYYNFPNESEVFLINKNGNLHILDNSGTLKFTTSIRTDYDVGLVYYQSRGEYELFINFDNQFAIYRFPK